MILYGKSRFVQLLIQDKKEAVKLVKHCTLVNVSRSRGSPSPPTITGAFLIMCALVNLKN